MVLELDNVNKVMNIDLRHYGIHSEFTRDFEERRVVLYILIKGTNKTICSIPLAELQRLLQLPSQIILTRQIQFILLRKNLSITFWKRKFNNSFIFFFA